MEGLLRDRGFDEGVVATTMADLAADGSLDDLRFAERFASDKREISSWGPERIRAALSRRGIPFDLIDEAVADDDFAGQVDRGSRWLAGRRPDIETGAGKAKALAALARQGYSSEVAYEVLRTLTRGERDAQPSG